MKSKVSEIGKQKAVRLNHMEGGAVPLLSYLSQPALDIRPAQLPVIRLGAEGPSAAVQPPLSTVSFSLSSTSATAVSFSSALEKNSASTLPFITPSVAGPSSAPGVPSSSPASSPVSGDPAGKFVQSAIVGFEARSSSSTLQETVNVTTGRGAANVAALGPSTSNGGGPPKFRFTELRPISSVQSVNSVHRQFVFSLPEPPSGQFGPIIKTVPEGNVSAAPAATSLCQTSSFATPSGSHCSSGGRINNGHSQLSAGNSSSFSSLENFSSSSCVGSNTNFSLGTNGGGGVHSPLLNFKSAAMPDVTNSAKLSKGVLKNSSNSLLPDITASTTFSFGAARQLKSGSVMDILGSSLAERPDHWVLPAPSQGWLAAVGIRY